MKLLRTSIVAGAIPAILFALVSTINHLGDWSRFGMVAGFGFVVGQLAVPWFFPGAVRYPSVWQGAWGLIAGLACALAMSLDGRAMVVACAIGLVVGLLAPLWIKHVQIP